MDDDLAYEVICDSRDDGWKSARLDGIGASEMSIVLGESSWSSRLKLYAQKCGTMEPDDLDDVEEIEAGRHFEWPIAEFYRKRTGRFVDRGGLLLRSKRWPWMLATLDAWTCDEEIGRYWPLEIKNVGLHKAHEWIAGAPAIYRIQAHQQMLVTGRTRATAAAFIGGQRLAWEDIELDDALARRIVRGGEEFWQRVTERNAPEPDGSDHSSQALAAMFKGDDETPLELEGPLGDIADEIERVRGEIKALGEAKARAENALKMALGRHVIGVLPDGRTIKWAHEERAGYTVEPSSSRVLRILKAKKRK